MGKQERLILSADSRSENMIRRLLVIPRWIRARRQRRMLLGASGCLVKATEWVS